MTMLLQGDREILRRIWYAGDLGAWLRLPTYDCMILPSTENEVSQKYAQRNQLKHTKKRYRVRNWREYEAGLCKRGDLTIWL